MFNDRGCVEAEKYDKAQGLLKRLKNSLRNDYERRATNKGHCEMTDVDLDHVVVTPGHLFDFAALDHRPQRFVGDADDSRHVPGSAALKVYVNWHLVTQFPR